MQSLTSRATPFTKFVFPGFFIAPLPAFAIDVFSSSFSWIPFLIWIAVVSFLVWWTKPIKRVAIAGDHFAVSNYFRVILVPQASLQRIEEDRWNRTPNICLYFDPPTEFGAKVRIIPTLFPYGSRRFEQVSALLRAIIERHRSPRIESRHVEQSERVVSILADSVESPTIDVGVLSDAEIDVLIDRLPRDSNLRSRLRSERQQRWYG